MNSLSYKTIEQIINEANTRDFDTMVSVPVDALRDLFKTVRRGLRAQGIKGFGDKGEIIVNDVGMIPIIKSLAKEDFSEYGPMKSISIKRRTSDLIWNVEMVFSSTSGDVVLEHSYTISQLSNKRVFKFEI